MEIHVTKSKNSFSVWPGNFMKASRNVFRDVLILPAKLVE